VGTCIDDDFPVKGAKKNEPKGSARCKNVKRLKPVKSKRHKLHKT